MINEKELAAMIDHSNLKADTTEEDLKKLCEEAIECGFKSVAINSYPVGYCSKLLKDSNVLTGAAISFPLGQTTIATKANEVIDAIENGAEEFDYVVNVGKVKEGDFSYIKDEMDSLVSIARKANVTVKVIFETCYLTEEEIIKLCEIANDVKPDFVKTNTGFGTYGAKVEDVKLMREKIDPKIKIKAAGGIRDLKTALEMIEAGASRIGTSSGINIIEELRNMDR